MYDLDDSLCSTFRDTFSTFMRLNECGAVWHVTAKGQVHDRNYHAGADSLIRRSRLSVVERLPRRVKSNISIPCVPLGQESLFLLPDLILVSSNSGFGAIAYSDLEILVGETSFVEDQDVPRDASVVGRTWRHVNKNGGPDLRFNDNRELPICKYEEVRFTSGSGLNELIHISRTGCGELLRKRISEMSQAIEGLRVEADQHNGESRRIPSERFRSWDGVRYPSRKSLDVIYDALLEILCCVMAADGRVTKSERLCIADLMRKAKSNMADEEVDCRIDRCISSITSLGYRRVLAQALAKVSLFKRIGKQDILMRCIDAIIAADSKIDPREKALCDQIKHLAKLLSCRGIPSVHKKA